MASSPVGACGNCRHCGVGVPFDTFYFYCFHCDCMVCTACRPQHPRSHADGLRRLSDRMLPWNTPPEALKQCANRNEKTYKRIECNICDLLVCLECLGDYQGKLLEHDSHGHKSMAFYVTPVCFTRWQVNSECTSCIVGSSVAHCGLCLEGL